ncbi:MAG TPA: HEPN domain-containing protein [Balneolales bacterium]|nr:HEPN domain-containing protein [Desulfobacteraceae bacterium]HKJ34030.1 HEPN domain-containing protein [Balneolales bacterium]
MSFNIDKTIHYWLESAEYDFETGKSLLESKKFPYALFFAHLAIEKILKAIVVKKTEEHAPHTHSLVLLAKSTNINIKDQMLDQLAEYMEFHIEASIRMRRRTFTKNVRKNLQSIKLMKCTRYING